MIHYGLTPSIIEEKQHVFGASSIPDVIVKEDGNWLRALPHYEPQFEKFETWGCTTWGTLNAIEILHIAKYGVEVNYAERFPYILSNTRYPGNDPHFVAEIVREYGLVDGIYLPMTDTYEEFIEPDPMRQVYLKLGRQWKEDYDFRHDWVFNQKMPLTPEMKIAYMRKALKRSPLGIAVTGWIEDENGMYVSEGMPNNHWCVLVNEIMGVGWQVFDSYDHSIKTLPYSHEISCAKRYWLDKRPHQPTWLERFISSLRK